jgi:hypothetical protein
MCQLTQVGHDDRSLHDITTSVQPDEAHEMIHEHVNSEMGTAFTFALKLHPGPGPLTNQCDISLDVGATMHEGNVESMSHAARTLV